MIVMMTMTMMMMNYKNERDDDVDDDAQVFLPCNDRERWRKRGRRPVPPSTKIIQVAFQNCYHHHHHQHHYHLPLCRDHGFSKLGIKIAKSPYPYPFLGQSPKSMTTLSFIIIYGQLCICILSRDLIPTLQRVHAQPGSQVQR